MDAVAGRTAYFTLRFDGATERAIIDLWLALAEEGIEPLGLSGHRPHITITAYEADDPEVYRPFLTSFAREMAPFPIHFNALGVFPENGVVYLAATVSETLFALHRSLIDRLRALDGAPVRHAQLLPDAWVPHCTLLAGASPGMVAGAVAFLQRTWRPIEGTVEGMGVLVPPATRDVYDAPFRDR